MVSIVISGPGGVGKGTIVARLLELEPDVALSRSWTTRSQRPGESDDAYVFVTPEDFDANIADGGFLEWVDFLDYRQGTPTPPDGGGDILFEIDVYGAVAIREKNPAALLVFVDAPDRAEQRLRLVQRGDSTESIAKRMAKGIEERRIASEIGMHVVVNDVLDDAVEDIRSLVADARNAS